MKRIPTILLLFIVITSFAFSQSNIGLSNGFVENKGQWDKEVKYAMQLKNLNVAVTEKGLIYDFYEINNDQKMISGHIVKMNFQGSSPVEFNPVNQIPGVINIIKNNDRTRWATGLKQFSMIEMKNIYPGISVQNTIQYGYPRSDFIVQPGSNPDQIKFKFEGASNIREDEQGIVFETRFGDVYQGKLFAFQKGEKNRMPVECSFEVNGNTVSFEVGDYDRSKELIIDPIIYSSFFGGNAADKINKIEFDREGNLLMCGTTSSKNFPTTPGSYDEVFNFLTDGFFAKINLTGAVHTLIFSTLFGTDDTDEIIDIGTDLENNIYICGNTDSEYLPLQSPYQQENRGKKDVFISKFTSEGDSILHSTYIGGNKDDMVHDMFVDDDGDTYFTGQTASTDFQVDGPLQSTLGGNIDAFVTKMKSNGAQLFFSTYIGGTADDIAWGISIDEEEIVYLTGETFSTDFPVAPFRRWYSYILEQPYDFSYNGGGDAFVIKLAGEGNQLKFSTYFGGNEYDKGKIVMRDKDGTVFFAGETRKGSSGTTEFPIEGLPYQDKHKGGWDCFFAKLDQVKENWNRKNQDLLFSTYFGGSSDDFLTGVCEKEIFQKVTFCGYTESGDFPRKGSESSNYIAKNDGFIIDFGTTGSDVSFSTFYGGFGDDMIYDISDTEYGDVFFAGKTGTQDLKMEGNSYQSSYGGGESDGFYAKVVFGTLQVNIPYEGQEFCPDTQMPISWMQTGFSGNMRFTVELGRIGESEWLTLAEEVDDTKYLWTIPEDMPPGNDYLIRISHPSGVFDMIDGAFTVLSAPKIDKLEAIPNDDVLCEYSNLKIEASASGAGLKYIWKHNGKVIANETTPVFEIDSVAPGHSGTYQVVVSGKCIPEAHSDMISISVIPYTEITAHPENMEKNTGDTVEFSCDAKGQENTFQWYKDDQKLFDKVQKKLILENLSQADSGYYYCKVQGTCGQDSTEKVFLKVMKAGSVFGGKTDQAGDFEIIVDNNNSNSLLDVHVNSKINCRPQIFVFDNLGNVVSAIHERYITEGENKFELKLPQLTSGVYWLAVECAGERHAAKFSIIK